MSEVDYVIEGGDAPLPELAEPASRREVDRQVAALIAAEIEDGACLQIGIGGMPNAVCALAEGRAACATSASTPRCSSTA